MSAWRIQRLTGLREFERCVNLQMQTWKYAEGERFPRRAFLLADRIGGHVLGALDGDEIVAFLLGYPGLLAPSERALPGERTSTPYLHSQMMAVEPAYQNQGIGRALKVAQREIALEQGIELIRWTYDPLEIKNAFFNLARLGAESRTYLRDFYGPSSSPLQGGLPTDRLYADWWVRGERVSRLLAGDEVEAFIVKRICVPAEIYEWKSTGDARAAAAQVNVRSRLEAAFAAGLSATGYVREADGSGCYLLTDSAAQERPR